MGKTENYRTIDVKYLQSLIFKKGLSLTKFAEKVSAKTHTKVATVQSHLSGSYKIPKSEVEVYEKLLGVSLDNASSKEPQQKKSAKKQRCFDYESLAKAIKDSGLSQNKVSKILGISSSNFCNWKKSKTGPSKDIMPRLCSLLNISSDSLFKEEKEENDYAKRKDLVLETLSEKDKQGLLETLDSVGNIPGFKKINTKNIDEIFDILNSNILLLAKNMDTATKLYESKIEGLNKEIKTLEEKITSLSKEEAKEKPKAVAPKDTHKESSVLVSIGDQKHEGTRVENLVGGYNREDSFQTYRYKINQMVSVIAAKNNNTHKQTLHQFYQKLNQEYGVVYDQLKKDFKVANSRKETGTIELVYSVELYRKIFYNLISTELSKTA